MTNRAGAGLNRRVRRSADGREMQTVSNVLDYFQIQKRGSNARTEVIAGATTFATMAYILIIQPKYMGDAGMDAVGVLLATALVSGVITIVMGLASNMPFALAPGMGSNAVLANSIVLAGIATWQVGLGMVFISGTVFLLLSIFGIRELIVKLIPKDIKIGISAGLGLFIIRTALVNAKLVADNFKGLGDLSQPSVALAGIGLIICVVLNYARFRIRGRTCQVRGAILLGIIITTVIGLFMGVVKIPESIITKGALASLGNVAFKADVLGALRPEYIAFMLAFFISDFFSTLGTSLGLANKAGLMDKDGNFPMIGRVFLVDSVGTLTGAVMGLTVVTTYVESASGVEVGGRTGLASIVTGLLFILAVFFAPLFLMIPTAATSPALVLIGISMMNGLKSVDFDPIKWTPVAILMIGSLFGGTPKGIAFGLVTYCVVNIAYYAFTDERSKETLPSLFTVILAILTCLQFFI